MVEGVISFVVEGVFKVIHQLIINQNICKNSLISLY